MYLVMLGHKHIRSLDEKICNVAIQWGFVGQYFSSCTRRCSVSGTAIEFITLNCIAN